MASSSMSGSGSESASRPPRVDNGHSHYVLSDVYRELDEHPGQSVAREWVQHASG